MDQRKSLIIAVLGLIVIVAIIVGTVVFLIRGVRNRSNSNTVFPQPTPVASQVPVFSTSPAPTTLPSATTPPSTSTNGSLKTYNGRGFTIQYPKGWGLLTCSNSANFELDPYNGIDQLNVGCNYAQKPVTILVGGGNCSGESVSVGSVTVMKSGQQTNTGTNYRWCTKTQPALDITHRVSSTASPATSNQDFSKEIEEIIKTFKPGSGS